MSKTMTISTTLALAAALGFVLGPPAVCSAASYMITDLGTLYGNSSFGQAINNSGQVVGYAYTASGASRAFLYSGGVRSDLGTLGGTDSFANAINDNGQVVGYAGLSSAPGHPFLYSAGAMLDLAPLYGLSGIANGVNNAGHVVGTFYSGSGPQAFLYVDGVMADTPVSSNHAYGFAINASGQFVGAILSGVGQETYTAYLANSIDVVTLGTLGGSWSVANGINDAGEVVGNSAVTGSAADHAFSYSGGMMHDLGTLGGTVSRAYGINSSGQIVGAGDVPASGYHAFLYTNGAMVDLNSLVDPASGWLLTEARAINDSAQIAGTGIIDGQTHAVLLTPVPEPSSFLLAALGLFALCRLHVLRRRARA